MFTFIPLVDMKVACSGSIGNLSDRSAATADVDDIYATTACAFLSDDSDDADQNQPSNSRIFVCTATFILCMT